MEQELVSGTIAAVVFENPENGYAVIKLDSDDGGLITVVGTIPAPGRRRAAHRHRKMDGARHLRPPARGRVSGAAASGLHGRNTCLSLLPRRAGRRAENAEKIVAAFGTDSLKILEAAPERLTEIDGISRKKALEIGASFRQQVAVRRLIEGFLRATASRRRSPCGYTASTVRSRSSACRRTPICWRSRSSAQASAQPSACAGARL